MLALPQRTRAGKNRESQKLIAIYQKVDILCDEGTVISLETKRKSTIGDNTRKYRNELAIRQDILPEKANLGFRIMAKIEAGATPNRLIETIKKIADALASRSMTD